MTNEQLEVIEWAYREHYIKGRVDDDAMTIRYGEDVIPRLIAEVGELKKRLIKIRVQNGDIG